MLVGLFRSNRPAVLVAVPMLVIGLFAGSVTRSPEVTDAAMPLFGLAQDLFLLGGWISGVVGMIVVAIISVQLAGLSNNADLLGRRNHLPALLFPLLLALFGRIGLMEPISDGAALLGMPLVIWALGRMFSISNTGHVLGTLFDAGLMLGLAAMFYLPYAFLVVVVWASVSVIRPFQWREYIVPLFGCTFVFYLAWAFLVLLGVDSWRPLHTVAQQPQTSSAPSNVWWALLLVVMIPLLLASLGGFASGYQRGVMRDKNLRSSFMAFIAGSGVIIGFSRILNNDFPAVLLAAPLAVFCGHALVGSRRSWLSEITGYTLLVLAIWSEWG